MSESLGVHHIGQEGRAQKRQPQAIRGNQQHAQRKAAGRPEKAMSPTREPCAWIPGQREVGCAD
jgi:hypothetical protein